MKSSKILDISKSSLVSLKAELLRKQEEVLKVKAQEDNSFVQCVPKQVKKTVHTKSNDGVEARNAKDIQENEEDIDLHAKSREMLKAKTRLYDKLKEGTHIAEGETKYLVDFQKKSGEEDSVKLPDDGGNDSDDENQLSDFSDRPSDPEDDWVDFVDALGRTRRCLRRDLPLMKSKDTDLQKSIQTKPAPKPVSDVEEPQLELFSADMHRAAMREKWEEQELKLKDKTDIHYQDILFDEARTHGVGYFNFSAEEEERLRQQDSLSKMRQDTTHRQAEVKTARDRRQQQMAVRLMAARRRRRERLGLPPEEEEEKQDVEVLIVNAEEPKPEDRIEDLEEALKRAAHVRPWDMGKDSVTVPEVMSQEEWVDKKRQERPEEFAPPTFEENPVVLNVPFKRNTPSLFFTSKKTKSTNKPEPEADCSEIPPIAKRRSEVPPIAKRGSEIPHVAKRGAEVPPPPTMEYYGGTSLPKHVPSQKPNVADSITAGLEYLRKQVEDKEKKPRKDFFEVISRQVNKYNKGKPTGISRFEDTFSNTNNLVSKMNELFS